MLRRFSDSPERISVTVVKEGEAVVGIDKDNGEGFEFQFPYGLVLFVWA